MCAQDITLNTCTPYITSVLYYTHILLFNAEPNDHKNMTGCGGCVLLLGSTKAQSATNKKHKTKRKQLLISNKTFYV